MSNAVEALKSYGQLDEEGIFVSVSRQAIEETLDELAECEVAILREKRRVNSLHMKINELETENKRYRKALESIKALPSLEKDRARLEWMAGNDGSNITKWADETYGVYWWKRGGWRETDGHKDWRDAIDEAMTMQGESNAG